MVDFSLFLFTYITDFVCVCVCVCLCVCVPVCLSVPVYLCVAACQCDLYGSYSVSCEQVTGQCSCRDNFAGRMCQQCKENFYNYPICEGLYGSLSSVVLVSCLLNVPATLEPLSQTDLLRQSYMLPH